MIVRGDHIEQQQHIEEDDHIMHNTCQSCCLACDAILLACEKDGDHHIEMPKQRNHQ